VRGGDDRGSASRSFNSPYGRDCRRVYCFPVVVRVNGKNRIMIYGPKSDGTHIVEFKTADSQALAISVPRGETAVLKHFQERMPYGLFVPEVP
jgi:hypothetical protein